jgi:lipopolysaccharide export system permease protein
MRLPRTLSAYVLREVLLYSLLGVVAITTVLVSRNLLRHLDELISSGSSAADVVTVLGCLASVLATYAVPVAFLFGVLLAIGRLASDVEILAMHSCGIGLRTLVVPVACLGFAVACVTGYLAFDGEHRAQRRLRLAVQTLAAEGKLSEPGEFRRVGERVLYVKRRGADDRLEGVLIADRSDPDRPLMIFAEDGRLAWDPERDELRLSLRNGDIHVDRGAGTVGAAAADPVRDRGPERYQRIAFRTFDYALEADQVLGVSLSAYRPREMTTEQLREVIARAEAGDPLTELRRHDPVYYRLHLQRRLALPAAPVLFALVGVPLGLRRARGGRSRGILVCAVVAFGYYALLTIGQKLALEGAIPAAAALWLPNAAFGGIAWALLRRARRVEVAA